MSSASGEPGLFDRVEEHPSADPSALSEIGARQIGIRFAAGALTSVIAGLLTILFGPHIGGVMLAFPAILAASLTLIAQEDDREDAREDARGSLGGAIGLIAFAVIGAVLFETLPGAAVLAIAAIVWLVVALALYRLLWWG